jgi:hypothetical protein
MKTTIYIDGQNFLYKAADVLIAAGRIRDKQDLHTFDFTHPFKNLLKVDDLEIRYYGTKLRKHKNPPETAAKSVIMLDSQRRLRNSRHNQGVRFIESGKLKLRDGDVCKKCGSQDPHFQEKGVDVRIAVDMLIYAQGTVEKLCFSQFRHRSTAAGTSNAGLRPIRNVRWF